MHYVCVDELRDNYVKMLIVAQQCFNDKSVLPATMKIRLSLYEMPAAILKRRNFRHSFVRAS